MFSQAKFFLSKRGHAHILSMNQLIFVFFFIFLTSNSTQQLGPDLAFCFVNMRSGLALFLEGNLPFFFALPCIEGNFQVQALPPGGAYIWRCDLTEGFLR